MSAAESLNALLKSLLFRLLSSIQYHPLTLGVLPIVLGAPNIEEYSPVLPGGHPAFINIRDYQNMSSLAAYLEELDRDDEKYLRYFEWRQAKDVAPLYKSALQYSWRDSPCMVCQSLHRQLYGTPIVLQGILPEEYDRRPPAQTGAQRAAAKARREKRRREKKEKEEQRKRRRREQADGATMAAAAPSSQDQQQQNTPPPTGEELARIQALMQEHALKASGQVKDEL